VGVALHAPPRPPTILQDPVIPTLALHKASHQRTVVEFSPAVLKDAIPVEKKVEVDSQGYCYWSLLHHTREAIAVVYLHTRIGVALYLELSAIVQTTPSNSRNRSLIRLRVSKLRGHSF
jgi:hypothetical protein